MGKERDVPGQFHALSPVGLLAESWLGEFGQGDRWRFCLTAAGMARAQERR